MHHPREPVTDLGQRALRGQRKCRVNVFQYCKIVAEAGFGILAFTIDPVGHRYLAPADFVMARADHGPGQLIKRFEFCNVDSHGEVAVQPSILRVFRLGFTVDKQRAGPGIETVLGSYSYPDGIVANGFKVEFERTSQFE